MFYLNKIVMSFILLTLPFSVCYADTKKANLLDCLDQKNLEIDQIQYALKKYVKNPFGWSALNYAIEVKDFESALIIAKYCADINQTDSYLKDSPKKINALERIFYNARIKSPKIYPSEEEIQIVYVLLERGIYYVHGLAEFSPLIAACYFDIDDLIIHFTEGGINVNAWSLSLLIQNGNLNMARYLITHGVNVNLNRDTLFNSAVCSQKIECIDFLLSYGLNFSEESSCVMIAFHFINNEIKDIDNFLNFSFPALEMLSYILKMGANPNFWIPKKGLNLNNYEIYNNSCALWLALELPSETNAQYFYKNYVIQVLLDHGAVIP